MTHVVKEFFPEIPSTGIAFNANKKSDAVLTFQDYNAEEVILGKKMKDWCRFSVCYWHTFCSIGNDPFGPSGTFTNRTWNNALSDTTKTPRERILEAAKCKADAAFEFFVKLGVQFYTFHDHDLIDEVDDIHEANELLDEISDYLLEKQKQTGVKCLWGTCNLFSHRRFMNGAMTNPDLEVFAFAAAKVKKALEITKKLGGENYVFWGGREGYQSILNTDRRKELDHMATFLRMVVEHKKKIGATFQLLIEPKPREPMKHQYDYDASTVIAFLHNYGLSEHFKLNIEPNHTTLAGHDYEYDILHAADYEMLGSIDCNTGDTLVGWDTDQFLMDDHKAMLVMKCIIEKGGLAPGGLNFDAKVRRESSDLVDIFIAHIGSMDCFARGLRKAAKIIEEGHLSGLVASRYRSWGTDLGKRIEQGSVSLEDLANHVASRKGQELKQESGKQELAELIVARTRI